MLLLMRDQLLIESDRLVGDAGPGEVLFHAFAAGVTHSLAGGGVFEQRGEFRAELTCELIWIDWEAGDGVLLERDKVAGFVIDHDFEDAPGSAGDHGGTAGHGLEVDDAEGFVDGGAAEDPGMGVELDGLGAGDHLLDPDDARVVVPGLVDLGAHLGGDLRRVGCAGAEDDLRLWWKVADGVDQMRDALLAS